MIGKFWIVVCGFNAPYKYWIKPNRSVLNTPLTIHLRAKKGLKMKKPKTRKPLILLGLRAF